MTRALAAAVKRRLARWGVELRRNPYVDPLALQAHLVASDAPVIVDVGAYTGETWALYRERWPRATVHAVEPFPDSAALLRERVGDDRLTTVHELALGAAPGEVTLHVNAAGATNSTRAFTDGAAAAWGGAQLSTLHEIVVPQHTLDALMADAGVAHVDLLKVDVQGAEYAVFEGARDLLSRRAIGLIVMEHIVARTYEDQRPLADYLALFERHGYGLVDVIEPIRRDGRLLQADWVFSVAGG